MTTTKHRTDDVFGVLARRLREVVAATARAERRQLERWEVLSLDPLTIGNPDGDIIAAVGDPDLHVASRIETYDDETGIEVGDIALVLEHDDDEWTLIDIDAT